MLRIGGLRHFLLSACGVGPQPNREGAVGGDVDTAEEGAMPSDGSRMRLWCGCALAALAAGVLGCQSVAIWRLNQRIGDAERVVRVMADASPGTDKAQVRTLLQNAGLEIGSEAWEGNPPRMTPSSPGRSNHRHRTLAVPLETIRSYNTSPGTQPPPSSCPSCLRVPHASLPTWVRHTAAPLAQLKGGRDRIA